MDVSEALAVADAARRLLVSARGEQNKAARVRMREAAVRLLDESVCAIMNANVIVVKRPRPDTPAPVPVSVGPASTVVDGCSDATSEF